MPFQKGESGNPASSPRGACNRTTVPLENLLAEDGEAIARKAIELAKAETRPARRAGHAIGPRSWCKICWRRSRLAISRRRKPRTSPR